ncbi:RF-1 domain-containing protein [Chytriomyces cf. hyalinus JEL632]|nr:RF-1 domain-containing protein [Chytriomyces cf. hyalinus JEL632]
MTGLEHPDSSPGLGVLFLNYLRRVNICLVRTIASTAFTRQKPTLPPLNPTPLKSQASIQPPSKDKPHHTATPKPILITSDPITSSSRATPPHLLQRKRLPITLDETQLEENFIKGSGKGGQKVNKAVSCVQLKHVPTGIVIKTQRFRDLASNRKEARKLLSLDLDDLCNGPLSKRNAEKTKDAEKTKRSTQKAKKRLAMKMVEKEAAKNSSATSAATSAGNDNQGNSESPEPK